ncbi:MAG: YheC/YheD family protein, partial [Bacillota bacterium]
LASRKGRGDTKFMDKRRVPVVAILTVLQGVDRQRPFAEQTSMLAGFVRHARELGMSAYLVTPEGVQSTSLSGWYLDGEQWRRKRTVPTPDVVYDRVPNRMAEKRPDVRRAKARLRGRRGVTYLGTDFFDKWQLHKAWAFDRRIARHVPRTTNYRGAASIRAMLRKHPSVYVKPRSSSLGLGIIRITGREPGPWKLSWRDPDGKRHDRSVRSLRLVARALDVFTRSRPYLVQQGIDMIPYHGRLFDIRAAVHRDIHGKWQITGMGVRLGFAKSIVTNMAAGAVARPLHPIIKEVARSLDRSSDEMITQLGDVALAAAEVLGDAFGDNLGEAGLDLAIDRNGHIWLLEANAKPLRTIFQELSDQTMAEDCLRKPMEYAYHLAVSSSPHKSNSIDGKRGEIE